MNDQKLIIHSVKRFETLMRKPVISADEYGQFIKARDVLISAGMTEPHPLYPSGRLAPTQKEILDIRE